MKIVYCVAQCDTCSGGARVLFEHVNRLAKRGHEVEIWSLDPAPKETPFPSNVSIQSLRNDYDFKSHRVNKLYPETGKIIDPDIFVATSFPVIFGYTSVPGAKPFWFLQHDEIVTCGQNPELINTYQEALALPVGFLSNSRWTQDVLREKYGVESKTVRCGLDYNLFYPSQDNPFIPRLHPSLVFVYDGQEWKGVSDIITAVSLIKNEFPDLNLLIISRYDAAIEQFFGHSMKIFCRPAQDDLRRIYSSADVFVSSSWCEGFGLPGLEAMTCGVPVVTTDSGGVREYAVPEETAIVVPPRNPQLLAGGILRVLKDEPLRQRLIKNGLEKVKEFDWEKSIDILEKNFQT